MPDTYQYTATNPQTGKRVGWDGKAWVPIPDAQKASEFQQGFMSQTGFSKPNPSAGEAFTEFLQNIKRGAMESTGQLRKAVGEEKGIPLVGTPLTDVLAIPNLVTSGAESIATGLEKSGKDILGGKFKYGGGELLSSLAQLGAGVESSELPRTVASTAEKIPLRKAAQEAVVSRAEVENARTEYNGNLRKLEEGYNKKVQETGSKNTADEAAYQLKRQQIKDNYAQKLADYRKKLTEQSAKQSAAEVKSKTLTTQPRSGPVYQRLSGMADKVATEDVPQLDKAVRTAYDARWGAWRQAMGDAQGDFTSVQKAVNDAEENILKGSPENIAIFRNILNEGEDPLLSQASVFRTKGAGIDVKEILGSRFMSEATRNRVLQQMRDAGVEDEAQPFAKEGVTLPIDDIRGYATELGNKMYRGSYSGDIYRALKSVREAAEGEVERVAKSKGQFDVYKRLKGDWSQYMEDFYDSKGPLTRLKNAVNSDSRLNLLSGSEGSRIIDALGRYSGVSKLSGSAIDNAGRIRSLVRTLREAPSSTKLPSAPERPSFPAPKTPRPAPERPNLEPFSAQKYRSEHIQKVAQNLSHITGWDVASIGYALRELTSGQPPWALGYPVGKRVLSKLLTHPGVVEYLSKELP